MTNIEEKCEGISLSRLKNTSYSYDVGVCGIIARGLKTRSCNRLQSPEADPTYVKVGCMTKYRCRSEQSRGREEAVGNCKVGNH
jgi:hypothetical protein